MAEAAHVDRTYKAGQGGETPNLSSEILDTPVEYFLRQSDALRQMRSSAIALWVLYS